MKYLEIYIYLIITVKILFLVMLITNKITERSSSNKKISEMSGYLKERLELLFKFLMSFFLIYMFYPYRKVPIPLEFESRLLLYLFGIILIVTANWKLIIKNDIFNKKKVRFEI